jgi:hypothetical protein
MRCWRVQLATLWLYFGVVEPQTVCTISLRGFGGGVAAHAAVRCSGPSPVHMTGSPALARYSGNFTGVTFTPSNATNDLIVLSNVEVVSCPAGGFDSLETESAARGFD